MTVSRMLREPDRVAPETAQRIRQAIDDTGYSPNKQAGGLASGRSAIVAAIIPSVANSVFAETIQGLSDALQPAGLELFLAPNDYKLEREEDQLKTLLGWGPAAIAVTGRRHSPGALALMRQAKRAGTPVIQMWDLDVRDTDFLQIGFNHHQVGVAMGEHLLACGYRDLAYVDSAVAEDFRAHERGQGLAQAARLAGAALQVLVAPPCEPMAAGRLDAIEIDAKRLPRALAFANDHLAAGACLQALELGLVLPDQLALLGYGDFPISQQLAKASAPWQRRATRLARPPASPFCWRWADDHRRRSVGAGLPNLTVPTPGGAQHHGPWRRLTPQGQVEIWQPASSPD